LCICASLITACSLLKINRIRAVLVVAPRTSALQGTKPNQVQKMNKSVLVLRSKLADVELLPAVSSLLTA